MTKRYPELEDNQQRLRLDCVHHAIHYMHCTEQTMIHDVLAIAAKIEAWVIRVDEPIPPTDLELRRRIFDASHGR